MNSDKNGPRDADRSIPELLQKLATETTVLVRQELRLALAELTEKIRQARGSAVLFGLAAVCALGAFGALTATLIVALALVLPLWAAALLVMVLYAIIAAICGQRGTASLKKVGTPVPKLTVETLHDDVDAVRAGVRRGR